MTETYYKDHWVDIEEQRFERYLEMFKWSESSRQFFEPAKIVEGDRVLEIGCGPGFTCCEIASWVGSSGQVDGVDINPNFVKYGQAMIGERGLASTVKIHCVSDSHLPFKNGSRDCIVAKNVLLYVDDPLTTFAEARRVLTTDGRFHCVEGDWGLLFAEPVPQALWREFIDAASIAFRTPMIGRKLYGHARKAGFERVSVSTISNIDITGRLLPMIRNLCSYARHSRSISDRKIDQVLSICEEAAESRDLMICSPQFLVTAMI